MDFFQTTSASVDQTHIEGFYPYFKDCVGVADCIHIPVMVGGGIDEQGPFRKNNGLLTQIVLSLLLHLISCSTTFYASSFYLFL